MRMNELFAAGVVASVLGAGFACRAGEPFTDEASILAISRDDQANDLKTKRLKKEFTLPAALTVLTTYQTVSRDQYLTYAHQSGAHGKVTVKGGKEYSWDIEPDYAATVKSAGGAIIYLLHPKLDAQPAPEHQASDVAMIATWVCGKDPAKAFAQPFGDSSFLTDSKDTLLYADVPCVKPPAGMRLVNYESLHARMGNIKRGGNASPAVLIARSSYDEPSEGEAARELRRGQPKPHSRVYYVEIAVGNAAWHWMKIVVWDDGGKLKAEILWRKVS